MKFLKIISLMLALIMIASTIAGCNLFNQSNSPNTPPEEPKSEWDELYTITSIPEAISIANNAGNTPTAEQYYIKGVISTITNPEYGAMVISDGTNEISVYNTKGEDGTFFPNLEEKPVKGDEVLLLCSLQCYNGSPEIKQAYIIDFKKAPAPDDSTYTEMSILDARNAEIGAKISITGVVARITYANGMKPSGVYVVDGTNSIYVYDGDIAGQVAIGNKITVLGSKTYWVLASEQSNADKFGYKGCCQLEDATLYANDNGSNNIDFSWCRELSVKTICELPVTENHTTTIFKTTALVKKVPGNGFVNYYFFDLDGETGAYTYTQCNGSDFTWIDKFDGKICTVYLSPINAKSTASNCYFRFLPISVIDEGFTFDISKAPSHVVEYYGVNQFLREYTGNPMLELTTSVSSTLLGFENITISYSSNNEDVVYFTEENGKTIFNCGENGVATVTVTATYGELTHSEAVEIRVKDATASEGITVKEAIDTAVGTTVKVEGIVGPSLANQTGFYIIDETGVLGVRVTEAVLEGLDIGQKVVLEGTISVTKDGAGQLCLDNATVVANYYGKEDYSTASFITGATMADIKAVADTPAATTKVYVITAKVTKNVGAHSTTYTVGDIMLYSGGPAQYAWLGDLFEEGATEATLTVELALCDWNAKGLKGCVLAVITEDGKIYNEYNFINN